MAEFRDKLINFDHIPEAKKAAEFDGKVEKRDPPAQERKAETQTRGRFRFRAWVLDQALGRGASGGQSKTEKFKSALMPATSLFVGSGTTDSRWFTLILFSFISGSYR